MEYLATALTSKDVRRLQRAAKNNAPITTPTTPTSLDRLPAELRQHILDVALFIEKDCRASLKEHAETLHNVTEALPALREDVLCVLRHYQLKAPVNHHVDYTFKAAVLKTIFLERVLLDPAWSIRWHFSKASAWWELVKRRFYCSANPECSLPDLGCSYCGLHDDAATLLADITDPVSRQQTRARLLQKEFREYARRAALMEELQIRWSDYIEIMKGYISPVLTRLVMWWMSSSSEDEDNAMPICDPKDTTYGMHLCFLSTMAPYAVSTITFLALESLWKYTWTPDQLTPGARRRAEIYKREKIPLPPQRRPRFAPFLDHMMCVNVIAGCVVVTVFLAKTRVAWSGIQFPEIEYVYFAWFLSLALVMFPFVKLGLSVRGGEDMTVLDKLRSMTVSNGVLGSITIGRIASIRKSKNEDLEAMVVDKKTI